MDVRAFALSELDYYQYIYTCIDNNNNNSFII